MKVRGQSCGLPSCGKEMRDRWPIGGFGPFHIHFRQTTTVLLLLLLIQLVFTALLPTRVSCKQAHSKQAS